MVYAVIFTAIPIEYTAVRAHISHLRMEEYKGSIYERGDFSIDDQNWEVAIVRTGAGNSAAGIETERAIEYFKPHVVLFVGVAGGIKDVQLGDVVVPNKVYGYESGKVAETFRLRPDVGLSNYNMIQRAKAEARKIDWLARLSNSAQPNVFVEPIAAGEKVVTNKKSDLFELLQQNCSDALAVEMEGYGFLKAAYKNESVSALVIRGISDLIDGKNRADEEGFQEIAARHASAFAFEVLAKFAVGQENKSNSAHNISIPENFSNRIGIKKFVGREKEIETLHEKLQLALTSVIGMEGIGKTELAIQYAHFHLEKETYKGGICWLDCRSENIADQIIKFAESELKLKISEKQDLQTKIKQCWNKCPQGDVLTIFDDVEDYDVIKDYMPPPHNTRFKTIVTTHKKWLVQSFKNEKLELEVLDLSSSLNLLKSFVGDSRIDSELQEAEKLCKDLGFLPLGLELVARYLERKETLSLVEMQRRLDLRHTSLEDVSPDMTAERGVRDAFELSWRELDENTKELSRLLSLLAPAPIPWNLVEQCLSDVKKEDLENRRDELINYSLLKRYEKDNYRLHPLIRKFFIDKLKDSNSVETTKRNVCKGVVKIAEITNQKATELEAFAPHIIEVAENLHPFLNDDDLITPFWALGWFYRRPGFDSYSQSWLEKGKIIIKERLKCKSSFSATMTNDLLSITRNLGLAYKYQRKYEKAECLYLECLFVCTYFPINDSVLIDNNNKFKYFKFLAILYTDFANLYRDQRKREKYQEAEGLYAKALGIYGLLYSVLLKSTYSLKFEDKHKAKTLYPKVPKYYLESLLEPLVKNILYLYNDLICFYCLEEIKDEPESFEKAEFLSKMALDLGIKHLGEEHLYVALVYKSSALLYRVHKIYNKAETNIQKALRITKNLPEEEPRIYVSCLVDLAIIYRYQGKNKDAKSQYLQALAVCKELFIEAYSPIHTTPEDLVSISKNIVDILKSLTDICKSQRRSKKDKIYFKECLNLFKESLGEEHLYTQDVLKLLNIFKRKKITRKTNKNYFF